MMEGALILFYFLALGLQDVFSFNVLSKQQPREYVFYNSELDQNWLQDKTIVPEYESQSLFWIELSPEEPFQEPSIEIHHGQDVLEAHLSGNGTWASWSRPSELNQQSRVLELQVKYVCRTNGAASLVLYLPIPNTEQRPERKSFSWKKNCGTGVRSGFQVGLTDEGREIVKDGQPALEFFLVQETQSFTVFYLSVTQGFGSQFVRPAKVTSSNPKIGVRAIGYLGRINVISETDPPQILTIFYDCEVAGSSIISVTLEISPYDPIVWQYVKSCGGEIVHSLNVGLTVDGKEVMTQGNQVPSFLHWKSSESEPQTDFYLSLTRPPTDRNSFSSEIVINAAYLSSSGPGVMKGKVEMTQPFIVTEKDTTKISVIYNCLAKQPDLNVTLILLISHRQLAQFSWKKDCVQLDGPMETYTATQLIGFMFLFLAAAVCGNYLFQTFLNSKNHTLSHKAI